MSSIDCYKFRKNPTINPSTGRKIEYKGPTYDRLDMICKERDKKFIKYEKEIRKRDKIRDVQLDEDLNIGLFDKDIPYQSSQINMLIYITYITKKYNSCFIKKLHKTHGMFYNLNDNYIDMVKIKDCLDNPLFVSLMWIFDDKHISHSNVLIFDNINRIVQRFEPHGAEASFYDTNIVDENLYYYFKELDYEYTNVDYVCPIGLQTKQERSMLKLYPGSCALWSLWYINYRIKYPYLSIDEINDDLHKLYNSSPEELDIFITKIITIITHIKMKLYDYMADKKKIGKYDILRYLYKNLDDNKEMYTDWIYKLEDDLIKDDEKIDWFFDNFKFI